MNKFDELPRVAVTPQHLVEWLRVTKKGSLEHDAEARARLMGRVVAEAMGRTGQYLKTDRARPELLYFDAASKTVLDLDESRGRTLRAFVARTFGINGADSQWQQAHEHVANRCMSHGAVTRVHKLSFWDSEHNALYIAKNDGEMFKITPRGRSVIPNGSDRVFFRTDGRLLNVEPAPTADRSAFELVSSIANFVDDEAMGAASARLLWECWQLCTFFPQLAPTRPIVLFTGDPGSRKTSAARAFGRTLLGPGFEVSSIDGHKLDGLDAAIVGNPYVVIDNADGSIPGLENRLAVVSTGGFLARRKLYLTMVEVQLPYDAFIVLTAHDPRSLRRPDVVDRELLLPCERDGRFRPESEVRGEIDANRCAWWGFVLDRLQKIVAALGRPRKAELQDMRLADYGRFVGIAAPALGYGKAQIAAALKAMVAAKAEFVAATSSIPDALAAVVDAWMIELHMAARADGIDSKEFAAKLADCSAPRSASALLLEAGRHAINFRYENPKSLGRDIKMQIAAIERRVEIVIGADKHSKAKNYALAPLGGWRTAVERRLADERAPS